MPSPPPSNLCAIWSPHIPTLQKGTLRPRRMEVAQRATQVVQRFEGQVSLSPPPPDLNPSLCLIKPARDLLLSPGFSTLLLNGASRRPCSRQCPHVADKLLQDAHCNSTILRNAVRFQHQTQAMVNCCMRKHAGVTHRTDGRCDQLVTALAGEPKTREGRHIFFKMEEAKNKKTSAHAPNYN